GFQAEWAKTASDTGGDGVTFTRQIINSPNSPTAYQNVFNDENGNPGGLTGRFYGPDGPAGGYGSSPLMLLPPTPIVDPSLQTDRWIQANYPNNNLFKTGGGTLTLGGNNNYNGKTTVTGGALIVDGHIGDGNVTSATGTTLGGSGNITGNV